MEWFKHSTGSHHDPDFSDAWDEFGDSAPTVFWTLLEMYGNEFSSLQDGWMIVSVKYFERELRRKWKRTEKILQFFQSRARIQFEKTEKTVSIKIPKFLEISSNWTRKKSSPPMEAPTELPTEAPPPIEEEEKKKRIDTLVDTGHIDDRENIPYLKILELYGNHLPMLPKPKGLSQERRAALKARWHQDKEYQDLVWWEQFFQFIAKECPFLIGQGEKHFMVSWDWIMKKANFTKIVEGNYQK